MVRGEYNVAGEVRESKAAWDCFKSMATEGVSYLRQSFFGVLVLLKATAALAYGSADILNVAFSEIYQPGFIR